MTNCLQRELVAMTTSRKRNWFLSVFFLVFLISIAKPWQLNHRSGYPGVLPRGAWAFSLPLTQRPWGRRIPQQEALLCSEGHRSRQFHEPGICLHSLCKNQSITRLVDGCRAQVLLGNTIHKIQRSQRPQLVLSDSASSCERP